MKMRRRAKIPTAQSLANIALYYLSRYAASEFSLRRVLENRIRRSNFRHPDFSKDDAAQKILRQAIDAIIVKHKKSGALNDVAYADMKIASLRRAGRSSRVIKQYLAKSGIARADAQSRLEKNAEDNNEDGDADFKAALILAKRKKLGPYRIRPADLTQKRKDMATMARAGFSFDIVRKVIGMECGDMDDF